jgi:hypothetical protein
MSLDPAVRAALGSWTILDGEAAWHDVLQRAGIRARRRRVRPGILVAAAALVALLLTIPALGIGGRLTALISGSKGPGLALGASLTRADGTRVGSFSLHSSRLFVPVGSPQNRHSGRVFRHRGDHTIAAAPFRWTLELEQPGGATEARLEQRAGASSRLLARLCKPCSERTEGSVRLGRSAVEAVFSHRVAVVVVTTGATVRGVVTLQRPARR